MSKTSLNERLMKINVALANSKNEPLIGKLSVRGWDAEKIDAYLALYDEILVLNGIKDTAYKKQFQATEELNVLLAEVRDNYLKYRKLAKVALNDESAMLRALQLAVPVKNKFSDYVLQLRKFYDPAVSDELLSAKLLETGVTKEEIEPELPKLDRLITLNIRQELEKCKAQTATLRRDQKLEELEKGMAELYTVGQVALADEPKFIKLLNINK